MLTTVQTWLEQPFETNMDVWMWALFVIFILTVAWLWSDVVSLITKESV